MNLRDTFHTYIRGLSLKSCYLDDDNAYTHIVRTIGRSAFVTTPSFHLVVKILGLNFHWLYLTMIDLYWSFY
jgi:hypothetical protein